MSQDATGCLFCGKALPPRTHGGPTRKYCGDDCGIRFKTGSIFPRPVTCVVCGCEFMSARKKAKCCSRQCSRISSRKQQHETSCIECGSVIPPKIPGTKGNQQLVCSEDCRRARASRCSLSRHHNRRALGLCVGCGAASTTGSTLCQACAETRKERERDRRKQSPGAWLKQVLYTVRFRASKEEREFCISADDLQPLPAHCPVLGIPLDYSKVIGRDNWPSVDRVDSSKGYVPGNVCVISYRANRIKNDGTLDEHVRIVDYMRRGKPVGLRLAI